MEQSRNALCLCGSGKKFKRCCAGVTHSANPANDPSLALGNAFAQIAECLNTGRYPQAEALCRQVLPLATHSADAQYLAGLTARGLGKRTEAVRYLRQAVLLQPHEASFHCVLGVALNESGQPEAAQAALEQALRLRPKYPEALNNLGTVHLAAQRFAEASAQFQQALLLEPRMAEAHYNLACALEGLARPAEAEAAYRQALTLHPRYFDALNNLGLLLRAQGRLGEAIGCCHQATTLAPTHARCHYNLGMLLFEYGAATDAAAYCARAIALQSDFAEAYATLATAESTLGNTDAALGHVRQAIALAPEKIEYQLVLAAIHERREEGAEALACYHALQAQAPKELTYRIRALAASLPRQVDSVTTIDSLRARLASEIDAITSAEGIVGFPEQAAFTLYCLAYHGRNDYPLLDATARLVRTHLPGLRTDSLPPRSAGRTRLHIGILSSRLHNHSIGKLNIGYIRHLDRSRFHVTVIHGPGSVADAMSAQFDQLADQFVYLSHNLATAQQQVLALQLDLLHYADIGMVPLQSLLAHARLAPVQTTSWGHPSTTGIPTMDAFLSFEAAEPPKAEAHYSERLIRMQHPPACFETVPPAAADLGRAALGLPAEGRLYGCLQTLIKFHPDFDAVLAEVLTRDPTAWIVAIADAGGQLVRSLQARWAEQHPILTERVVFLPQQSSDAFLALIGQMDLLLDTPHFGSGVSFYESVSQAVPTVTWPGEFLRGRLVSGFYHWLGIEDAPIVSSLADYAVMAVTYAQDVPRLARLRTQLQEKGLQLFDDRAAVLELEDVFQLLIEEHASGYA